MLQASLRRTSAVLLALLLVISQSSVMVLAEPSMPINVMNETLRAKEQIGFSLQEVKTKPDAAPVKLVKLNEARTHALLSSWHAQVREIPGKPGKNFATPIDDKPAPAVLATANPFLSDAQSRQHAAPLGVREALPIGDTGATGTVSIHFTQQMVPLSSIAQMNDKVDGVSITPAVGGKWQWLDTETLQFKSTGQRLPMATRYQVVVGTNLSGVGGTHLPEPYVWSFATPPITNAYGTYSPPVSQHNFVTIGFDQKVSAKAILPFVRMKSKRGNLHFAVATEQELAPIDSDIRQLQAAGEPLVIFKILDQLKTEQAIDVEVSKKCPSAEGPICSEHEFKFQCTVGPRPLTTKDVPFTLTASQTKVVYGQPVCFAFSRQLAPCDANKILTVTPSLIDQNIRINGNRIIIFGRPVDGIRHTVQISKDLKDDKDAHIGRDLHFPLTYVSCAPKLCQAASEFQILKKSDRNVYPIYSVNVPALHVEIFKCEPSNFIDYDAESLIARGAELVNESFITTAGRENHYCRTDLPLSKGIKGNSLLVLRVNACTVSDAKLGTRRLQRGLKPLPGKLLITPPPGLAYVRDIATAKKPAPFVPKLFCTRIQVTDLSVATFAGSDGYIHCWTTNLDTGLPESGVKIEIGTEGTLHGETDAEGLANIFITQGSSTTRKLVACKGDRMVFLPYVSVVYEPGNIIAHAFTDRGLYKPGESVQIKGWLRYRGPDCQSDLEFVAPKLTKVSYKVVSARQKELAHGDIDVDALQSFHLSFSTEKDVDLGTAYVRLMLPDGTAIGDTPFNIEEFRPPEFEMSVQKENSLPKYLTDPIKFTAQGKYFSSGPLSHAKVNWNFVIHQTGYSPPGLENFSFQKTVQTDAARGDHYQRANKKIVGRTDLDGYDIAQALISSYGDTLPLLVNAEASVTDFSEQKWSKHESCLVHPSKIYVGLRTDTNFVSAGKEFDFSVVVADVDGHKLPEVPVKLELFQLPDEEHSHVSPKAPELITTVDSLSGEQIISSVFKLPAPGRYGIKATVQDDRGYKNVSSIIAVAVDPSAPRLVATTARRVRVNPTPDDPGRLKLTPNKKKYEPNETAELVATSPFKNCVGLLTVVNNGIAQTSSATTSNGTLAYTVPIHPAYIPFLRAKLHVHSLDANVGASEDQECSVDVPVSCASRALQLKTTVKMSSLRPGETNRLNFVVKKSDGQPAADANVCAIVVDESVLALNGYSVSDPLEPFYRGGSSFYEYQSSRSSDVALTDKSLENSFKNDECPDVSGDILAQLASVDRYTFFPNRPDRTWRGGRLVAGRIGEQNHNLFQVEPTTIDERHYNSGRDERHQKTSPTLPEGSPVPDEDKQSPQSPAKGRIRTEFGPLALFEPNLRTDATGHGTISFTAPDSLTRYRVFVVAACEDKLFGKTEANFVVDQPVTLRPSAPRFANIGDCFDVPFVVTNTSDKSTSIEVAACAEGAASGAAGYSLSLLPNQRATVFVHATGNACGTGTVRGVAIANNDFQDRVAKVFPVIESLAKESVATYGSLSRDAVNKAVQIPTPELTKSASLDLSGSASAVNELRGAASYLGAYPFSCSEQLSSQILAFAAIKRMPEELAVVLATRKMVKDEQVTVDALSKRQIADGSFQLWPSAERQREIPFVSIHATHALAAAKAAGYSVSQDVLDKAAEHLHEMALDNLKLDATSKQSLLAYACYTECLLGKSEVHRAKKLLGDTKLRDIPTDVLCWLAPVLKGAKSEQCAAILDRLKSTASETASTAHFTDINQNPRDLFSCSDNRLNALALQTLVLLDPQSTLIPKIAKGLLLGRQQGHWLNTNDDSFAFGALYEYFNLYEKEAPDFALNVWFDGKHYVDQTIAHRTDRLAMRSFDLTGQLAANPALSGKSQSLIVKADGPGRFYYRLGMQYEMKDPIQKELDRGFKISRHYEAVTDKDDVVEQASGSVKIKKGATVKIVTEFVVPSHRYYVAMVDNLPAAFESINAKLNGNSTADSAREQSWYQGSRRVNMGLTTKAVTEQLLEFGWGDFFQNLRDERTEVFRDDLPPGYYRYAYLVRATTAGHFLAPPAHIEEMYEPETFGRSDSFYVDVIASDND